MMVLQLNELPWPQIESEIDQGNTLIIVMTASIEQHGPSLPLAVDTLRADTLGERIADELGCFVAPTIRPGISAHHMDFPGTITLETETFKEVVRDYCRSLDRHGFENIALITTHGGNAEAIDGVAAEMDRECDAHTFAVGDRKGFMEIRYGAMAKHDVGKYEAGKHAGAAETAFIMESNPDLVSRDALSQGHIGEVDSSEFNETGMATVTENGVLGDQTLATRDAGQTLIDDCVEYYTDVIRNEVSDQYIT